MMDYIIRPLDSEMKGIFDLYNESYPDTTSRMPILDEVNQVIARFGTPDSVLSHLYIGPANFLSHSNPVICSRFYDNSRSILSYIEKDDEGNGPFMSFSGGYMDIVGPIVKELSRVCGPLIVLFEEPGDIITPETDLTPIFDYIRAGKNIQS